MAHAYPPLRPYGAGEVWAQTAAEAGDFDADAIERIGIPQAVLMENAGRSTALVLQRLFPEGSVVGMIGAGNNGGDALVALRSLAAWGRDVLAVLVADRSRDDPLLHAWPVPVLEDQVIGVSGLRDRLGVADVVMDGVLGTGIRGEPRARQSDAIRCLNESERSVLAIDVPSGIDATTGSVSGAAVRADVTVSFGAPKLGALLHPGRALVGRHVVVDIGFPPLGSTSSRVVVPGWAQARLPRRGTDTHKNRVGRVLVVAGQIGMAGAAILAARGAFRAGAGLVRICSIPENRGPIQSAIPEAMFIDASDDAALEDALDATDALAVGPGMGTNGAARALLGRSLAGRPLPTVLDADALNLAATGDGPELATVASARPLLITPHPGEMARLLGADPGGVRDRVEAAQVASRRFGCVVLLKGAPSLVASPGCPLAVDSQSSSDLAVAGMGDVLTGVCAGLMAQGLGPDHAAPVALYLSGRAARIAGRGPALTPSDVLRWLPDALTESGESKSDLALPFVIFDADPAR